MKEILKYYLTIKTSLLDNIFSKGEEEKKKILKNLIIFYLIFTITPEIISFFTPIWKLSYGLWAIFSWIPPYVLFIKNIILNLLFICIWAYLANFLLKKFWEKDWFLVFFIWWFYWSIFIILAFILKELLPYLIWIINENNAWIFSILFMIFGFLTLILAIWGLVLSLVLYINRLKGFLNLIKYLLAYIILWIIIIIPINLAIWSIIYYYSQSNWIYKNLNLWSENLWSENSWNYFRQANNKLIETNLGDNSETENYSAKIDLETDENWKKFYKIDNSNFLEDNEKNL